MRVYTSDWHMWDLSERDRCDWSKVLRAASIACECGATSFACLGDGAECLKGSKVSIAEAYRPRLRRLGHDLKLAGVEFLWCEGNHNRNEYDFWREYLTEECGFARVTMLPNGALLDGWYVGHGDEFDAVVHEPVIRHIARGFTWFAGNVLERVWPDMPENWANPVAWVTPAGNETRAGAVGEIAKKAALLAATCEHGTAPAARTRILMGHTHRQDIWADPKGTAAQYANTGACVVDVPFSVICVEGLNAWRTF